MKKIGSAWSFVFSSPPQRPMTSDFKGFSIPEFIHYIYFPILILEKEPVFSLLNVHGVLNNGTTGTIFITSLLWHGPWLGIEPGPPALEASTIPLGFKMNVGHLSYWKIDTCRTFITIDFRPKWLWRHLLRQNILMNKCP